MKKNILLIFISLFVLCSCSSMLKSENSVESENTSEFTVSSDGDISVETVKNDNSSTSVNDFAFYNMDGNFIISLLSREDDIDYENNDIAKSLTGFDIINFNDNNSEDVYVDYIYFSKGANEVIQTGKEIKTAGNSSGKYNVSTENDIIEKYSLDINNEEIISQTNSIFKTLTLYFNIDSNGNAERIVYPKGTDISNFNNLDDCNAFISFEISNVNNNVMAIMMKYKNKGSNNINESIEQ